jgi:hypothetical protein
MALPGWTASSDTSPTTPSSHPYSMTKVSLGTPIWSWFATPPTSKKSSMESTNHELRKARKNNI